MTQQPWHTHVRKAEYEGPPAKLVVFGTGSMAELAAFCFHHDSPHEVVGFAVDEAFMPESGQLMGLPVWPWERLEQHLPPGEGVAVYVAVGYKDLNRFREQKVAEAKARGYRLAGYLSSRATCFAQSLGAHCFIFEDNTLQPFVQVGDNVVMWSGNHIGHHGVVEDHCFITSHVVVSGHVRVGHHSFLGVNATLRDSISIGPHNIVGAQALIMKPTEAGQVFVPARTLPYHKDSSEVRM